MPDDRDPKAEQLKYFHYRLHRVDAQPMLRRNGDFILRKMRQGGHEQYAVSVRWSDIFKHFPVQKQKSRYCFEGRCYRHIRDLIEYHVDTGTPLTHASGAPIGTSERPAAVGTVEQSTRIGKAVGKGQFRYGVGSNADAGERDDEVGGRQDAGQARDERKRRKGRGGPSRDAGRGQNHARRHPARKYRQRGRRHDRSGAPPSGHGNRSSLERLLRSEGFNMDTKLMLAKEAADGIGHIHRKGYVHRDVAARNCLVEKNGNKLGRLKITDFGMARFVGDEGVYKVTNLAALPVAWSALESLESLVWTRESDIWALGVLLWEIFNDGAMPYNEYESWSKEFAIATLKSGKRLEIPENVPKLVAAMMEKCWNADPRMRPSPHVIADTVKKPMSKK